MCEGCPGSFSRMDLSEHIEEICTPKNFLALCFEAQRLSTLSLPSDPSRKEEEPSLDQLIRHTNADGSVFEGTLKDGLMSGEGVLTLKNGDLYRGSFLDGKYHGQGELRFRDTKAVHSGNFVAGFLEGPGIAHQMFLGVQTTTECDFVQGKLHGKFKLIGVDGATQAGTYVNGFVEGSITCHWPIDVAWSGGWK
eukprot:gene42488-52697_t